MLERRGIRQDAQIAVVTGRAKLGRRAGYPINANSLARLNTILDAKLLVLGI
jgi:hypothetical protein